MLAFIVPAVGGTFISNNSVNALAENNKTITIDDVQVRGDVGGNEYYITLVNGSVFGTNSTLSFSSETTDYITIFLDNDDIGTKLSNIVEETTAKVNYWASGALFFKISKANYDIYNGTTVRKIEISKEITIPTLNGDAGIAQDYTFINDSFGNESDKYSAFYFNKESQQDIAGVQIRADVQLGMYYFVLNQGAYNISETVLFNTKPYNLASKVRFYLDEYDEGTCLSEIIDSSTQWVSNRFISNGLCVPIKPDKYEIFNGSDTYKIVVEVGAELPVTRGTYLKTVTEKSYLNGHYKDGDAYKYESFSWFMHFNGDVDLTTVQIRSDYFDSPQLDPHENHYIFSICSMEYIDRGYVNYGDCSSLNVYDKVKFYLNDKDEGKTLREIAGINSCHQNFWSATAFMIELSYEAYSIYNGQTLYKVTIDEGAEILIDGAKAQLSKRYAYVNPKYGSTREEDKYGVFEFNKDVDTFEDFGVISITGIHNRADRDAKQRWLMIVCNDNFESTMNVSNWVEKLNFLDYIRIYSSKGSNEYYTLRDIYDCETNDGTKLRMFGDNRLIGIGIEYNYNEQKIDKHSGPCMYKITFDKECQFPYVKNGIPGYKTLTESLTFANDDYGKSGAIPGQIDDKGQSRVYDEWSVNWSKIGTISFKVEGLDVSYLPVDLSSGTSLDFSTYEVEGYDLNIFTEDGDKVYKSYTGTNHNMTFVLKYTPKISKKGCKSSVVSASVIISVVALSTLGCVVLKRKEHR